MATVPNLDGYGPAPDPHIPTPGSGSPVTSTLGADATITDGAEVIALPDYTQLTIASTIGSAGTVEAGGLRINQAGTAVVEFRINVLHGWGNYVIFGGSWNDGPVTELGRVQINSNSPIFVIKDYRIALQNGGLLKLYISSNFEWSEFEWSNGHVLVLMQ